MINFSYRQNFFEKFRFIYSKRIYEFLVSENSCFYLMPCDIISTRPALFGYHEPHIENFIVEMSREYGDFLLDVGANIGLTSALTGKSFRRVECIEPNNLVANILKTNLALHLPDGKYRVHGFGLGHADETMNLKVPLGNFGGAYIAEDNAYVESAGKDSTPSHFDERTEFLDLPVKIKSANKWLKEFFGQMEKSGHTGGVIKIDVEGYESIIVQAIIDSLPDKMRVVFIMENLLDSFDPGKFKTCTHALDWYYLEKKKRPLISVPFKLLGLSSLYEHVLSPVTAASKNPHDIICEMRPTGQG